jgi:hypothetical protein
MLPGSIEKERSSTYPATVVGQPAGTVMADGECDMAHNRNSDEADNAESTVSQILADLTLAISKTQSDDEQQELVKDALAACPIFRTPPFEA